MLEFLRRQLMKYPPKSPNDLLEFNDTHIRNAVYSRAPRLYSRGGEHRAYKLGSVPRQGRGLGASSPRSSAAMDSASYPEDSPRDAYTTHGGVTASYSGKRQTGFVKGGYISHRPDSAMRFGADLVPATWRSDGDHSVMMGAESDRAVYDSLRKSKTTRALKVASVLTVHLCGARVPKVRATVHALKGSLNR